jgi:spore germination cell wall hydrolase CwlJ-like protein
MTTLTRLIIVLVATLILGVGPEITSLRADGSFQIYRVQSGTSSADTTNLSVGAFDCLARTLYFEARSESTAGQIAVGQVVLNRAQSGKFPTGLCAVVQQGRYTATTIAKSAAAGSRACQFTWYCDGIGDEIGRTLSAQTAWKKSQDVAAAVLVGSIPNLVDGATHYHTKAILPAWAKSMKRTATIDNHIFYRDET